MKMILDQEGNLSTTALLCDATPMIIKEKAGSPPQSRTGHAGFEAEKQMAFYLRREFAESPDIFVFNDVRLVRDGEVAQIDHLVLHPFGFVLIESKSVTDAVEVNEHLEFVRVFGRQRRGMKSPIIQVKMQADLLEKLLNDHKESLRRKLMLGMVQGYFGAKRFELLVAISDNGVIRRNGAQPPELVKADRVTGVINELISRRKRATGIGGAVRYAFADMKTSKQLLDDDLPPFSNDELEQIREFLLRRHEPYIQTPAVVTSPPRPTPPPVHAPQRKQIAAAPVISSIPASSPASIACRHCTSTNVEIVYGKYGYYFKCRDCQQNTKIDSSCSCGDKARISKKGLEFRRKCSSCGSDSYFFTNPQTLG